MLYDKLQDRIIDSAVVVNRPTADYQLKTKAAIIKAFACSEGVRFEQQSKVRG